MCFCSSIRPRPFGDGLFGFARFGPVASENLGLRRFKCRESFTDGQRYQPMQLLASALKQSLIRSISYQSMLELVDRIRRYPPHIKQFGINQSLEGVLKFFLA